jgi:NitT/TauT family transport system substrate-binding protein
MYTLTTLPPGLSRRSALAAAGAGALLGIAGCDSAKPAARRAGPTTKLTYLTGFARYGREEYVDVAIDRGYFADQGLEVTVQSGAAGDSNRKLVSAGRAQFAAVDMSGQLVAQGNHDTATIAVAAVHQRTIISIMAGLNSGITSARDLPGKTLAQATGAVPKTLFPAYAQLAGIRADLVTWQETTPNALTGLLKAHQVAGIGQFVVGRGTVEKVLGAPVVLLEYAQYLTSLYGNAIITSKTYAHANPGIVRRFVTAILQGLTYSVIHPDAAGAIIQARTNKAATTAALAADELRRMQPYVGPINGNTIPGVGVFDENRVAQAIATLQGNGLMPSGLKPSDVVALDLHPWTAA